MQVYSGCYIEADALLNGNIPVVHVCTSEQDLVDALLRDIGSTMGGITAGSLVELCELLQQYCEDPKDCIAYSVTTV